MCFICMIIKRYQVLFENFVNKKIGICEESPPKMQTVAETLLGDCPPTCCLPWKLTRLTGSQKDKPEKLCTAVLSVLSVGL